MHELAEWDSFYVIVGSGAGALIGLQFVVMTLVAERPIPRAVDAAGAYLTPTVIYFCAALLLSAILRMPWRAATAPAWLCGLMGVAGIIYTLVIGQRMRDLMRTRTGYRAEFEDWLCYFVIPLAAYLALAGSAVAAPAYTREALFGFGIVTLVLLFTGIHNAWDSVSYHLRTRTGREAPPDRDDAGA